MACGACKDVRADLKKAAAAGDVRAAARAITKGVKVATAKLKAPPVTAGLLRRR